MKFNSTFGFTTGVSFYDAVFTGFARDGGLLMPEKVPTFSETELNRMKSLSYIEIVKELASRYISEDEIPIDDLQGIIDRAFSRFSPEDSIVPLRFLRKNLAILELFHGPTMTFKDYGMSCLAQFVNYFLKKNQQRAICIVATSGDTGGAALEAFKNNDLIDMIVLLPKGGCSPVQELQMTTIGGFNTHVIRGEGTSDDLDVPMKEVLLDKHLNETVRLFSVNSINIGRILVQTAHHLYAYLQASKVADNVRIVVPSGALGNITSGCLAARMGIPIKFVLCTNTNDVSHKMVETGILKVPPTVHPTISYAMNIQMPYNISRLLWIFSGMNFERTRHLSLHLENSLKLEVPSDIMSKLRETILDSQSASDETILETMRKCWERHSYAICPHTACGVAYCIDLPEDEVLRVVVATASPAKFPEITRRANIPYDDDLLNELRSKTAKYEDWSKSENWSNLLRQKVKDIIGSKD